LPAFELFEKGSQVRRSSKTVTALIVEGYGRKRYKADFIKFLVHLQTECDKTIVHLSFLFERGFLTGSILYNQLKNESLTKRTNKFIQWVEDIWNDFPQPETNNLKLL